MSTQELFNLDTAQLCLDFVNTLSYRHSPHPEEHLLDYQNLLDWSEEAGLLDLEEKSKLQKMADTNPADAIRAFEGAIALREILYRILAAHTSMAAAADQDLQAFNRRLCEALAHARLSASADGYRWSWSDLRTPRLERPWWPVARSAAELLTSPQLLERLGQCADPECGWLFLDTSKSRTRKWCDINDCGNRAKQRRFQSKKRGEVFSKQ